MKKISQSNLCFNWKQIIRISISVYAIILLSAIKIYAQTPITITAADIPIPSPSYPMTVLSTGLTGPSSGTNQTWNYATSTVSNNTTVNFPPATDTFFTNAGVDVTLAVEKEFSYINGGSITMTLEEQWDLNSTGLYTKGYFSLGGYIDLGIVGLSNLDTLGYEDIKVMLNQPFAFMKFPYTANSSWYNASKANLDLIFTSPSNNLLKAPLLHQMNLYRKDSIIGWGKLQTYTPSGPSTPVDVLLRRTAKYTIDSFFVNGSTDSIGVMNYLNLTQGRRSDVSYFDDFLGKGDFRYLMRFVYTDSSYSTLSNTFLTPTLVAPASVRNMSKDSYAAIVYPMPAIGNEVNVQLIGKTIHSATYQIQDIQGRVRQQGETSMQANNTMKINLNSALANGQYIIQVLDEFKQTIVNQHMVIQR